MEYKAALSVAPATDTVAGEDAPTRKRVAMSVLEHGPSSAVTLAERLDLTAAGIRRHLEHLVNDGLLHSRPERIVGERRRGRPAQVYELTPRGRERFANTYDDLATELLSFLSETGGEEAVLAFARHRWDQRREHYLSIVADLPHEAKATALAQALSEDGYPSSVINGSGGEQICQHHCPVANVRTGTASQNEPRTPGSPRATFAKTTITSARPSKLNCPLPKPSATPLRRRGGIVAERTLS